MPKLDRILLNQSLRLRGRFETSCGRILCDENLAPRDAVVFIALFEMPEKSGKELTCKATVERPLTQERRDCF